MRIFLIGVACVGKTTIGRKLAPLLGVPFFDLDEEIESFFGKPITRIQNEFLTMHSFRMEAGRALEALLSRPESEGCVIVLPPSGLMAGYLQHVKKARGLVIVLHDDPGNILARITFYDDDSRLIDKQLTEKEKTLYLREIKKDMTYFRQAYRRADFSVNLSGLGPDDGAEKVSAALAARLE